jgi:16S rRNA G1207 methylase RsmC
MEKPIISAEELIKFFEKTAGVQFVDVDTGKPALETIRKNLTENKSDYDIWLEQQDENVKSEQEMGSI